MKTKKIFPVLLIAIAFFTASCVDNTVSPQVEAIRGQQVEWMKAKTATELALAAFQTAQTDYQKAVTDSLAKQTAFLEATRSWSLKNQELAYNYAKAKNDVDLAEAKNALAKKQAELNAALAQLAKSVADSKSQEAATYLAKYNDQVSQLTSLYSSRVTLQNQIATAKLNAAAGADNAALAAKAAQTTIDGLKVTLATQNVTLASQNATLATLNSTSGASILVSANQAISLKKDSLTTALNINSSNISSANNNVNNLQYTIATYNNIQNQLNNPAISPSTKASLQSQLDALKTSYDDAVTKYPQYVQYALKLNTDKLTLTSQIATLQNTINSNSTIISFLNNNSSIYDSSKGSSVTGAEGAILYLKSQISSTQSQISSTQSQISSYTASLNSNSTEISDDNIAKLTKQLDALNTQITTIESQAASWKSLLDKLFTA